MGHKRIGWALGAALLGHIAVLLLWSSDTHEKVLRQDSTLVVVLTRDAEARDVEPEGALEPIVEAPVEPVEKADVPPDVAAAEVEIDQPVLEVLPAQTAPPQPVEEVAAFPRLNLERPHDFDLQTPQDPTDAKVLAFRPEFSERLNLRQSQQSRQRMLGRRHIAQAGLSPEAYNALEPAGSNHVKTAEGCFDLRADVAGKVIGPNGQASRWWRTACKGLIQSVWQMAPIEYDAIGRAIGTTDP